MIAENRRALLAEEISVPVALRSLDGNLIYHLVLRFHLDSHRSYLLVFGVHLGKTY